MATYKSSDLIPTPTATDAQEGVRKSTQQKEGSKHSMTLRDAQRVSQPLLPTPRSGDSKGGKYQRDRGQKGKERPTLTGLISSQADSPASHFRRQASAKARKMTVTSGQKCYESYESFSPAGSSVKMLVGCLLKGEAWYSDKCDLTWKMQATKSSRLLFQLSPSTRPTGAIESGSLLATPRSSDGDKGVRTPEGYAKEKARWGNRNGEDLPTRVAMLPTPTLGGFDDTNERALRKHQLHAVVEAGTKSGLKLQPSFALWMMGYPTDWLDLEAGEMPLSKARAMQSSPKSPQK